MVGPNSVFAKINGLSVNSGTFEIDEGRDFTTVGNLLNPGTLAVGTGSQFAVVGNYTSFGTARLIVEVAGLDPATQFGQLTVSANATLAGSLDIDLVNGFHPTVDDAFRVVTYANHTGQFALRTDDAEGCLFAATYDASGLTLTFSPTPGDANFDCRVDRRDLAILVHSYGMTVGATWEQGDFNQDGRVSLADLALLKRHFGSNQSAPSAAAVPEPNSLSLVAFAAVIVGAIRCRQRVKNRIQIGPRRSITTALRQLC